MSNIIDYKDVLKYLTDNICSYDIEKQGTDKLDELLKKEGD